MSPGDRDGLIARIRQVRRTDALREQTAADAPAPPTGEIGALEARIEHLEQMVEGLQDSVHREFERHAKLLAEIHEQIQPGAMSASLADDARQRRI